MSTVPRHFQKPTLEGFRFLAVVANFFGRIGLIYLKVKTGCFIWQQLKLGSAPSNVPTGMAIWT